MNRERRHRVIYLDSSDHLRFLHVLQEGWDDTCERSKTGRDPLVYVNPVKQSVGSCARRAIDEASRVGELRRPPGANEGFSVPSVALWWRLLWNLRLLGVLYIVLRST